jgi:hypothetical protein
VRNTPGSPEDEIKTLVVDDKWLATLADTVRGELDRVSQTLTGRIRQLRRPAAAAHRRGGHARQPRGRTPQKDGAGMEVKPGYKQTEVGVIPEDWEIRTGEQLTTLIGKGGSPRWQGFEYSNAGMLFVTSENVRDGFLDIRDPKYLPLAFHEKLKRTKLRKHDILINLVGASIGRSCQILEDLGEANVNQAGHLSLDHTEEDQERASLGHPCRAPPYSDAGWPAAHAARPH